MTERERCECETCCNGEHAGYCKNCAGWGEYTHEDGVSRRCEVCDGDGVCIKCGGVAASLAEKGTTNENP